jgi:hypothetical protein
MVADTATTQEQSMDTSKLDLDEVMEAARESMFGMGTSGFCLECGAERDGCEPDAEGYECYECGAMAVVGAETLLVVMA